MQKKVPELPDGWSEAFDATSATPYYFNRESNVSSWEHPRPDVFHIDMDEWNLLADRGELDLYTCVALRIGRFGAKSEQVSSLLPRLIIGVVMQLILPIFIIMYQATRATYHTDNQSLLFRLVGFILYLYAILSTYNGALDECRAWVMNVMVECRVSGSYMYPVLMGEFINAFVGWSMAVTVFLVYCQAQTVEELLLNCIAVSFVTEIDAELCDDDMKDDAHEDLVDAVELWQPLELERGRRPESEQRQDEVLVPPTAPSRMRFAFSEIFKSRQARLQPPEELPVQPARVGRRPSLFDDVQRQTANAVNAIRHARTTDFKDPSRQFDVKHSSRILMKLMCKSIRIVGTVGTGMTLAFVFTFAHYHGICDPYAAPLPWPWNAVLCG